MERGPGRPRGKAYPHRVEVYLNDEEIEQARQQAEDRGLSVSGLMRQLLQESARRRRRGTGSGGE